MPTSGHSNRVEPMADGGHRGGDGGQGGIARASLSPGPRAATLDTDPGPMDADDFARLSALILDDTGIRIAPGKGALLAARLAPRLRALGLRTYGEYYRHALGNDAGER